MRIAQMPVIPPNSKPWANFTLMLLTLEDFNALPDQTIVIDIFGNPVMKDGNMDTDTRAGFVAYGFLKEVNDE